jgi:hypothetical protein
MANRVDALVKTKQAATPTPTVDRSPREPQLLQLPATHHAMLAPRQIGNLAIDVRANRISGAPPKSRPTFFIYATANVGLVGHSADGAEAGRTFGARFVPRLLRESEKRPQPAVAASGFDPFK